MNPVVSIIIPTYKPSHLLKDCLHSILNQTYKDYELVIILNGCNEPYYTKIQSWIKECNLIDRTRLIQTDVPGVSNARNVGIEKAKGDYICFIDDDDLISEDYLSGLVSKVVDNVSVVFSDVLSFETDISQPKTDNIFHHAYETYRDKDSVSLFNVRKLLNGPWGKLYDKNIIKGTTFNTVLSNGEDALFNYKVSRKINMVEFSPSDSIYYYRLRPTSATRKKHSCLYLIKNALMLNKIYSGVFFRHLGELNFMYYVSRMLACWKFAVIRLINN